MQMTHTINRQSHTTCQVKVALNLKEGTERDSTVFLGGSVRLLSTSSQMAFAGFTRVGKKGPPIARGEGKTNKLCNIPLVILILSHCFRYPVTPSHCYNLAVQSVFCSYLRIITGPSLYSQKYRKYLDACTKQLLSISL